MKDYVVSLWILGKLVNVTVDAPNMDSATKKVMDTPMLDILGRLKVSDLVLSHSVSEVR